jgi:hypothetical protein
MKHDAELTSIDVGTMRIKVTNGDDEISVHQPLQQLAHFGCTPGTWSFTSSTEVIRWSGTQITMRLMLYVTLTR